MGDYIKSGIKINVLCLVFIGLMLGVFVNPSVAAVKAVKDTTLTVWPSKIYYFARLSGPDRPYDDITVNITAVDEYTFYINGELIGSDNDWRSVEEYTVSISGSDVIVGIQVNNSGTGIGNGLMIDIKAGADWLGTTTLKRRSAVVAGLRNIYPVIWYYYTGDIVEFLGKDWYTLQYDSQIGTTILDDKNITSQLGQVILGSMGDIYSKDGEIYQPDPHIEIVAGYLGDVDIGSAEGGGIQLRRIEGENIALGKPAQEDKITDGDPTESYYGYTQNPLNTSKNVDLENMYCLNRVVLYTGGKNPNEWVNLTFFIPDSPS